MAKRKIDGVLLLDKPFGWSSNNILQKKVRWLFQAEKAGHTGVLDPFATGLLPLCFGEATKFAQRMLDADKGYRATIQLGQVSTTLDGEGGISRSGAVTCGRAQIEAVLQQYTGPIEQIPPMHSALKFEGKALYEYAREGIEIERKIRHVTIYQIDIVSFEADVLVIDVACSKGTYIRTLADDIGRTLGCGAYLAGLRRTQTAGFKLAEAVTLDELIEMDMPAREALLLQPDTLLQDLPAITLDAAETERMLHGMSVARSSAWPVSASGLRLYGTLANGHNGAFIGLGEVASDDVLRPKRLLAIPG